MLDDTLVVFASKFGRTTFCQGTLKEDNYGRDHHPKYFTTWMAGGGVKGGLVHGETDDFSYNIVRDPVHVRDLNATILHLPDLDHNQLTFPFLGLDHKRTGDDPAGKSVRGFHFICVNDYAIAFPCSFAPCLQLYFCWE